MNDQMVLDTLVAGRALIEVPRCWVQGATRTNLGFGVYQRCAGGACSDALVLSGIPLKGYEFLAAQWGTPEDPTDWLTVLGGCMNELRLAIPPRWTRTHRGRGIVGYNDDPLTTHADILAVFDIAIGRVRARIEGDAAVQRELAWSR